MVTAAIKNTLFEITTKVWKKFADKAFLFFGCLLVGNFVLSQIIHTKCYHLLSIILYP